MMSRMWWVQLAGAALLWSGTGCGGIEPGDYIVYRIAFQETQMGSDCFVGMPVPVDQQDDSSSFYTSGTFILYATADDTFFLDTGVVTLEGKETGDDEYEFEGVDIHIEYSGLGNDTKSTTTFTTTVDFIIDGELVEGDYQEKDEFTCVGISCPNPDQTSCTRTTPFVGTEVEDVQLKHQV